MSKENRLDVRVAVEWAARNYRMIVTRRDGAKSLFNWSAADSDPPPLGESYVEFAEQNPTSFFKDTVPKFLGANETDESEEASEERRSIEDIRKLLSRYRDASKT